MDKANDISLQSKDASIIKLSECLLDEKNISQSSFEDVDVTPLSSINGDKPQINMESLFQNFNIDLNLEENNGNDINDSMLSEVDLNCSERSDLENNSNDVNKNVISNAAILDLSSKPNTHNITIEESTILQPMSLTDSSINDGSNLEPPPVNCNQINANTPSVECRQQIVRNQSSGIKIPIIGYEIMEERARFTIYKLRIDDPRTGLSWMVFRRYTDFVRLYSKLKMAHPTIYLPLPGKRWFKDNFDPRFLDDRIRGLQLFINAVIKSLSPDPMVRDFFCLDEPPPVCDSEPESLALFSALEDTVKSLKNQLRQKEEILTYLRNKVTYFEDKMKCCENCNPGGNLTPDKNSPNSPGSSGSG